LIWTEPGVGGLCTTGGDGETKGALYGWDFGTISLGVKLVRYVPGLCAYVAYGPVFGVDADADVFGCGDCVAK